MEREIKDEKIWIKLKKDKLDARKVEEFTVQQDCGRGLKFNKIFLESHSSHRFSYNEIYYFFSKFIFGRKYFFII